MSRTLPRFDQPMETMETGGLGALQTSSGNLPLKRIFVRSDVDGLACQTSVVQVFRNPHDEFVEATYIFPLPGRHAVTSCTMRVGDRVIEAELQERSQARAVYNQAIRDGHRASIAEEERSETFNLRVGNIPPREEVTVELTLVGNLSVVGGEATLRIPLVVAPRYVPGSPLDGPSVGAGTAWDTDQVPDASRVTPPTLLPGFPNPVELSIEATLNPGKLVEATAWRDQISCSLHSVVVSESDPCKIRLQPDERINRDFILRFPVSQEAVCCGLEYSHPDGPQAGTFAITILPPAESPHAPQPRDIVFVLDRSGSMSGWKIVAARRAVARMIDSLGEEDRFRVLAFDNVFESPTGANSDWQPATDRNRWRAAEWIAKIDARGGTELGGALRAAIQPFATFGMPEEREAIVVVITDGQVAGEDSVLRTLGNLGLPRLPRIFTMGIDRAVNASMLTRLAEMGGGSFEMVESERRLDEVMDRFHREIRSPVLTDLKVEPLDFDLVSGSVTPSRLPDVFADRPVTIYGRIAGQRENVRVRVTAHDSTGATWQQELTARRSELPALLPLWGRGRVRDLEDRYARGDRAASKLQSEIVAVSLESHVLSRFTAYVAVDRAEVVNQGGQQHKVVQPVEEPEGWELARGARLTKSRARRTASLDYSAFAPPAGAGAAGPAELVPESVARENNVMPVEQRDGKLVVRMTDPDDFETVERLGFILNREIEVETASAEEIQDEINQHYGQSSGETADSMLQEFCDTAIDFTETVEGFDPGGSLGPNSVSIMRLVQMMLTEAIQLRATHVYLSPEESHMAVYYIIDGECHDRDRLPQRQFVPIVGRLCDLANIPDGTDELEAGKIELQIDGTPRDVHVYIIPTSKGPSVLLRFANVAPKTKTADRLTRRLKGSSPQTVVETWLDNAQASCGPDPDANEIYQQLVADSLNIGLVEQQ